MEKLKRKIASEVDDQKFVEILTKVCKRFGYEVGLDVIVDMEAKTFNITDPAITEEKMVELSLALEEAIQVYHDNLAIGVYADEIIEYCRTVKGNVLKRVEDL